MQSRRHSLMESHANMVTSLIVSWLLQVYVIPPVFGVQMNKTQGTGIVLAFTVVSFARGYAIRRIFAARDRRAHLAAIAALTQARHHNEPRRFGDHGRRRPRSHK